MAVRYVAGRVAAVVPVAFLVTFVTFFLLRLVPGDPAAVMLGPQAGEEQIQALRERLGLDRPVWAEYIRWLTRAVQGDLGDSIFLGRSVWQAIAERLEPTVTLTVLAVGLAAIVGVTAGVASAWRHRTAVDHAIMLVSMLGVSIPNFWLALMLSLLFAVQLGWLPATGFVSVREGVGGALRHLVLPATALALQQAGIIARMTRAAMLETLHSDYVRTARAKGVGEGAILWKHALRNSLIPIVTVIGVSFTVLLAGAIVVETVFNMPGLGRLIIQAVVRRDYPVVQGAVLVVSAMAVLVNLAVDLLYAVIDPRVRYE
ncbi:MAG TPA: ABC transporter permease [Limnochordales bacterium]